GIDADHADDQDHGIEQLVGDQRHLGPQVGHVQVHDQQQHVSDKHTGGDAPDKVGVVLVQQGAGIQAVHDEGAQQNGNRGGAGDAQGEQGDQSGAGVGVVGRLGTGDALNGAVAEAAGVLGRLLLHGVGDEGGDGGA